MRGRPLTEHVAEVVSSAVRSAFLAVENEILSVARTRPPADVDGTTALLGLQVRGGWAGSGWTCEAENHSGDASFSSCWH
jgi:hypothetical protein